MKRAHDDDTGRPVVAWYGNGWAPPPTPPDGRHTSSKHAARAPKDAATLNRVGVVLGRFRPVHLGHVHLVDEAFARCGWLHVVARGLPSGAPLSPGGDDVAALHRRSVEHAFDELADVHVHVPDTPAFEPAYWADVVSRLEPRPTHVFSSDPTPATKNGAAALAQGLGIEHVLVDPERRAFPLSSSFIRAHMAARFHLIAPAVRAMFALDVGIVGAEGSGKSSLAHELGVLFDAPVLHDALREHRDALLDARARDVLLRVILGAYPGPRGEVLRDQPAPLTVSDDTALVARRWAKRLGLVPTPAPSSWPSDFDEDGRPERRDLWLLCVDDFYDGPDDDITDAARRRAFTEGLRAALLRMGARFVEVRGQGRARVELAAAAVRAALDDRMAALVRAMGGA